MVQQVPKSEIIGSKRSCPECQPLAVHETGREHSFSVSVFQFAFRLFVVLAFLHQQYEQNSKVFGKDVSERRVNCTSMRQH